MARRTTLYQRARSPLIQGYSKMEQPLWRAWLMGVAIGLLPLAAFLLRMSRSTESVTSLVTAAAAYLAASALGSLLGAGIGRAWGSRTPWLPAFLVGSVAGALALLAVVQLGVARL